MGGSKAKKAEGPPINAQSPDEESFIKYVLCIQGATASNLEHLRPGSFLTSARDFLKSAEADGKNDATAKEKVAH